MGAQPEAPAPLALARPMVRLWCWAAAAKLVVPPSSPGAGGPACRQLANELTFWTRWRGRGSSPGDGGIRAGGPRRWP